MNQIAATRMHPIGELPRLQPAAGKPSAGREDIFFKAIELTRMPMILTDPHLPDNPIVFANAAFCELCGYGPEELVGRNCRFLQGPDTDPATLAALREAIAARRDIAVEMLNYRKDGSTFWNALYVSPVFAAGGEVLYFFASQIDVSARRAAEDALRDAQKMEAVGQFTGGLAHHFNNMLTVVQGGIEGALDRELDAKARRKLQRAAAAATRIATLTHQMLAFGGKQPLQQQPMDLNGFVHSLSLVTQRALGPAIKLRVVLATMPWSCQIDPKQAQAAMLTILRNAADAMPAGGQVTIETANYSARDDDVDRYEGVPPGDYVTLAVTDTGTGMPAEVLRRANEPFFTTKPVGAGSGMGLAMVYGFMRQSQGYLCLASKAGHGTTVRLFFPALA
jgi:PAS domain S-box-containing protein